MKYAAQLKKFRDERATVARAMRDLHEKAETEKRAFTGEDTQTWTNLDTQLQALDAQMRRIETLAHEEASAPAPVVSGAPAGHDGEPNARAHADAYRNYLRFGVAGCTDEQRAVLQRHMAAMTPEMRAFSAGTGNTGGFTVPEDFLRKLEVALKHYGPMLDSNIVTVLTTDSGANLPMPTLNDTGTTGEQIGENVQAATDTATPFGVVNLGAYIFSSKVIPVSIAFLQDSAFSDDFIINLIAERIGRILNQRRTTGTGSAQPSGVVTGAASGKVGATGQTTTVIYDDLIDLVHAVDVAYRKAGAGFMMNDSSLGKIRKLKDANGLPIFVPGFNGSGAGALIDTVLGYPVHINNDMAVMAANARSILFGAFKKYHARNVRDVSVLRLTERYADFLQVGFIGFLRSDSALLDAGTNPVKFYANSAT